MSSVESAFSRQRVEEFRKTFRSFDKDGNGHINESELKEVVIAVGEHGMVNNLKRIIAEVDTNRNGTIEFNEFLAIMQKGGAGDRKGAAFQTVVRKEKELVQAQGHSGTHSHSVEEMNAFAEHIVFVLQDDPECKHLDFDGMKRDGNNLCREISDGILLCSLINKAVPGTISFRAVNSQLKKSQKGKHLNEFEIMENLDLALSAAKDIGVQTVNMDPSILKDCRTDPRPWLVLGLIWQIVKIQLLNSINLKNFPELARLLEGDETLQDLMKLSPDQLLLRWFNYHLKEAGHPKRVNNFSSDLKDSEAYSVLLHQIAPGKCGMGHMNQGDLGRAKGVLDNASKLNVHAFIKPQDIVNGNTRLNMAFTASIFNMHPGLEPLEEAIAIEEIIDETREERAYRMWMNSLEIDGVRVNHLYDGLYDGFVLLKLMDHIQPGIVNWKKVNMKAKNKFQVLPNDAYAVEVAQKGFGVKFGVNNHENIYNAGQPNGQDADRKTVLSAVWQLMTWHSKSLLSQIQSATGGQVTDDEIIAWCNASVAANGHDKELKMQSMKDKNLSDSRFFLNLLHSTYTRGSLVDWSELNFSNTSEENRLENARYAITLARKLGATVFLLPEDIVDYNHKLIVVFLGGIMLATLKRQGQ